MEVAISGLLLTAWLAAVVFFRLHRIWLLYYTVGSVGFAVSTVLLGKGPLPFDYYLRQFTGFNVNQVAGFFGIPTQIFETAPGTLLIMVISQDIGWTVLDINIECSGLLELSIFAGLMLFYPAWSFPHRLIWTTIGLVATYLINIVRVMLIVAILHYVGKDSLFIAHTIAGRAVFFFMMVFIYWFFITRPTIFLARKQLAERLLT